MPTPSRFSTAQVLNVLERFFLIDCGEGTQIQLRRFSIRYSKINHIFISHLHGDHFLGLFGLISSFNLLNRKLDLHIYGPFRLKEVMDVFLSTFDRPLGFSIVFHPHHYSGKQLIYEDDKLTVETFPLRHRVPTCGFLFKEKARLRNLNSEMLTKLQISIRELQKIKEGSDYEDENGTIYLNSQLTHDPLPPRSYAFISDTSKTKTIVPFIQGVDLLYHEATYADEGKKRAKETGHSTARQAAEIARLAGVKQLVIGHFSNRYKNLDILLKEAQQVFPNTVLAIDGQEYKV